MSQATVTDLGGSFGPVYWGFVVSTLLSGITILQAYNYFPRTQDQLYIQITAGCMLVLDILSTALIAQSVYYYLIPHFGSLIPLDSLTPELSTECLTAIAITLISQLYFANQIHAVTKTRGNWWIPALVAILAIMAFAASIGCASIMFLHKHSILGQRSTIFSAFFGTAKGLVAVTDIVATIAMCYYLSSSRTGITRTNDMITWLMHLIIHRGILVTIIQSALLIVFYVAPHRLYWLAFHVNVTKLYANVFFAMLNARNDLKAKSLATGVISLDPRVNYAHGDSITIGHRSDRHDVQMSADDTVADPSEWYDMRKPQMPMISTAVVVSDK